MEKLPSFEENAQSFFSQTVWKKEVSWFMSDSTIAHCTYLLNLNKHQTLSTGIKSGWEAIMFSILHVDLHFQDLLKKDFLIGWSLLTSPPPFVKNCFTPSRCQVHADLFLCPAFVHTKSYCCMSLIILSRNKLEAMAQFSLRIKTEYCLVMASMVGHASCQNLVNPVTPILVFTRV